MLSCQSPRYTSSSAMAERPRELGDFEGVGQFEAKFLYKWLLFRQYP